MTSVSEMLADALERHRLGDLNAAEEGYNRILRLDPQHADALQLLGVAALARGRPQNAVDWFTKARENCEPAALLSNNLGTAYRDLNRNSEALVCFQEAVQLAPEFAGAHFNLAMTLQEDGETQAAADEYEEALANDPRFAAAFVRLGCLQVSEGHTREGLAHLECAVRIAPQDVAVLFPRAKALFAAGDSAQAEESLKRVLRFDPRHDGAREALRQMTASRDDSLPNAERALHAAQSGLQRRPDDVIALIDFATKAERAGRFDILTQTCQRILELVPEHNEAHRILGRHWAEIGESGKAVDHLQRTADSFPHDLDVHLRLSNALQDLDRIDAAVGCLRGFVQREPHAAIGWYNLGKLLQDQDEFAQAAECYQRTLAGDADFRDAAYNLGIVCRSQGRGEESLATLNRLLKRLPDDGEVHLQRALTWLSMGKFARGWDEYEWRWQSELRLRRFEEPLWDGSPLGDRTILVYAEQGVGDEIWLASCLDDVVSQAGRCIVECDPRLVALFARSYPECTVCARPIRRRFDSDSSSPQFDLQIPMASLPRFFRRDPHSFPERPRKLIAAADRLQKWRDRFAQLGDGLKVGISWRGGLKPDARRSRSTTLDQWLPLFEIADVRFVNLQYGDCRTELNACREKTGTKISDWDDADPLTDLDDFAAEIRALDLVISIDNSTVHLAGALGVPVWTLLPFGCDFRWLRETVVSPWYPSMQLFRQPRPRAWDDVFASVAEELSSLIRRDAGKP
ncbi:MAG: tetratricopeptide repeat protein [Planctomycetes bacterium]|nr:tetratricopeptide repeat protein [Planctomycetota bacterium]